MSISSSRLIISTILYCLGLFECQTIFPETSSPHFGTGTRNTKSLCGFANGSGLWRCQAYGWTVNNQPNNPLSRCKLPRNESEVHIIHQQMHQAQWAPANKCLFEVHQKKICFKIFKKMTSDDEAPEDALLSKQILQST